MLYTKFRPSDEPFPFEPRLVDLTLKLLNQFSAVAHSDITVLDVGCGFGRLVEALRDSGINAYGCDISADWSDTNHFCKLINPAPYKLPFESNRFDVVITNSIWEHVHDHVLLYNEIKRCLKPGGCEIHIFPGRWYFMPGRFLLPVEPHIRVPFMHWLWPRPHLHKPPFFWFLISAYLGFKSPYQQYKTPKQIAESNLTYSMTQLNYLPHRTHKQLSYAIFGNCSYPLDFFYTHTYGFAAKLYRLLPIKPIISKILMHTRHSLMIQRKSVRYDQK